MNNIDWLLERMKVNAEADCIVWKGNIFSYADVLRKIESCKKMLAKRGISQGSIVSLIGDYSPYSISLLLALIENKNVVLPLSSISFGEKQYFLEVSQTQIVIEVKEDEYEIDKINSKVNNPLLVKLVTEKKPGLVLFTSGSTGKPKGILHDFYTLLEKYTAPRHTFRSIVFLLMDHIGGINTLFYQLSNHGTIITVEKRDIDTVCRAIQDFRAELLPVSPTFLNLLLISETYKRYDLTSLKMITYGTEVMPEITLKRANEAFPNVNFLQTYGLSELGILRSKSMSSDSLFVKVGGEGYETKVKNRTLWIRGRLSMLGYLNAPSPFDEDGWFDTGDVVEQEGEFLKFLGRTSEMINAGGQKVYPTEVEDVVSQMDGVTDVVVHGEKNPLIGSMVVAVVRLATNETESEFKERMRAYCKSKLANYKIPVKVIISKNDLYTTRFKKIRHATTDEK